MKEILLPNKIIIAPGTGKNDAVLTVEPCFQGYGTTVGNALRRVLLSSLPGAACYAVKIKGVQHEFSPIKGVKEDALGIILNLKQLRLKVFTDEPVRLVIKAKGAGVVKAKDIEKNSDIEIINDDLYIAELTDKDSALEMEIMANRGRGYLPIEERDKSNLEVGHIAMDALYSPVLNVGFKVENTRVGEITDYDKLVMNIETDGTITPEEAVNQSVAILLDYFTVLQTRGIPPAHEQVILEQEKPSEITEPEAVTTEEKEEKKSTKKKVAKKTAKKK
ncbi:MAG: DNA-directed RNA polymerase subunit alpha [Patescibacteria group bacterium]|nr:DNA-directed RNA polymerase subunit alpha [Patescibacteria group bacterium]